ncbi:Lon protease family protein [Enterobacillus tribolii]|nr:Lon protease family protein [Enterobacillus tribolii]
MFDAADAAPPITFSEYQPRLENALRHFCHPLSPSRFMMVKADETREHYALLSRAVNEMMPESGCRGSQYHIDGTHISIMPAEHESDNFAARQRVMFAEWVEPEQLFGAVRCHDGRFTLEPGLVHQVNGGVLILSLRALLSQPLMWLRLKQIVISGTFIWHSPDETRPLPISVPNMPVDLKIILVSDREELGALQDMEPELSGAAVYGEFEADMPLIGEEEMTRWCQLVTTIAREHRLPPLAADIWPALVRCANRAISDQSVLPLSPSWIARILKETAACADNILDAAALNAAQEARRWREGYLPERLHDEIELGQILIETEGAVVGQINGLSVLEYPGHPTMVGEPSRISCVVHLGDGEFTDVERKAELGGNIHAKGMMIMQAFLISELELEQQLPFSASLVFEQSYGEVDGDSASLAELCALISALSQQPLSQEIAVTGSVDQFGHVQPIGGVNEKIEGFFDICRRRGLSGSQGVILPLTNLRHLCLQDDVIEAVKAGQFHLWAVENAADALPILTGVAYNSDNGPCLIGAIQERIALHNQPDKRQIPWLLRLLTGIGRG